PALLPNTPTAPSASSTAATAVRLDSSSVTSRASVLQPRSARSAIDSGRRAVAYTCHPDAARRSAVARPNPEEQPVTKTAREASALIGPLYPGPPCARSPFRPLATFAWR